MLIEQNFHVTLRCHLRLVRRKLAARIKPTRAYLCHGFERCGMVDDDGVGFETA
jgi:hypothetical protein